jgi:hypothetical protein
MPEATAAAGIETTVAGLSGEQCRAVGGGSASSPTRQRTRLGDPAAPAF